MDLPPVGKNISNDWLNNEQLNEMRLIVSNTNEQEAGTESTQALISAEQKMVVRKNKVRLIVSNTDELVVD